MTNSSEHFLKLQSYLTKESVFFSSGGIPFHPLLHILNVRHQRLSSRVLGKMLLFWKALLGIRLPPPSASFHSFQQDWLPMESHWAWTFHFSLLHVKFFFICYCLKVIFFFISLLHCLLFVFVPLFLFLQSYFASELNGFWVFKRLFKKRASFSLWQKQLFLFCLVFFLSPNKTKLNLLSNGTLFSWLWVPNPYFLKLGWKCVFIALKWFLFARISGSKSPVRLRKKFLGKLH